MIKLITTVDKDRHAFLPQFVNHYKGCGVDEILISAHVDSDLSPQEKADIFASAERILTSQGVPWMGRLDCKFDAMATRAHHNSIQATHCAPNDWIVWADIDEFQEYWDCLPAITAQCEADGSHLILGDFVDRIAADGRLPSFDPQRSIWDQFPLGCDITARILRGMTNKVVCSRADVLVRQGNHTPVEGQHLCAEPRRVPIHHFKWDDSVLQRLQERLTDDWKQRCHWWVQTQRFFDHIAQHGCINLAEVTVTEGFTDAKYTGVRP